MDSTSHAVTWFRRGLGTVWAGSMMLAGLILLFRLPALETWGSDAYRLGLTLSVLSVSGGQFVFMATVADDIFPNTPTSVNGFLKVTAGIVFWGMLLWVGWQIWNLIP